MSSNELIVDDDYIRQMGKYYYKMGNSAIDIMLKDYINIMQEIKDTAIMEGDIADSLSTFIQCAQSLKDRAGDIGNELKQLTDYFISDIDEADQFLF